MFVLAHLHAEPVGALNVVITAGTKVVEAMLEEGSVLGSGPKQARTPGATS